MRFFYSMSYLHRIPFEAILSNQWNNQHCKTIPGQMKKETILDFVKNKSAKTSDWELLTETI